MVSARPPRHNRQPKKKSGAPSPRARPAAPAITKEMRVAEVLAVCPSAQEVLAAYGIHCAGCSYGGLETLEEGVRLHGFDDEELRELVDDLTDLLRRQPERPQTLTLTTAAAKALKKVLQEEKRKEDGLLVTYDETGSFCMEFRKNPAAGERTFMNREEPDVRVFASPLTLGRIGGSTIDYREGRFKLDLSDEAPNPKPQ